MKVMTVRSASWITALGLAAALVVADGTARAQGFGMGGFSQKSGEEIWSQVCQGCHMPDAKGATGAGTFPALAGDKRLAAALYPTTVIIHGQRGMPSFGPMLDDAQVAAIVNYVRSHFGNRYTDTVTPAQVADIRAGR